MKRAEIVQRLGLCWDSITVKRDGSVVAKRSFFYTFGGTVETYKKRVLEAFPMATILAAYEHWAEWPDDSYWYVRFTTGE